MEAIQRPRANPLHTKPQGLQARARAVKEKFTSGTQMLCMQAAHNASFVHMIKHSNTTYTDLLYSYRQSTM